MSTHERIDIITTKDNSKDTTMIMTAIYDTAKKLHIQNTSDIPYVAASKMLVSQFKGILIGNDDNYSYFAATSGKKYKLFKTDKIEQIPLSRHRIVGKTCIYNIYFSMASKEQFIATSTEPRIWTPTYGDSVALEHNATRKKIKYPSLKKVWPQRYYIEDADDPLWTKNNFSGRVNTHTREVPTNWTGKVKL